MKSPTLQVTPGHSPDFAALERPFITPALLAAAIAPSYCSRPAQSGAVALAARVMNEPDCSNWLFVALGCALRRDPVDAVNDAELLLSVLSARLEEIQGGAQ